MRLKSPSGTVSKILQGRKYDYSLFGFSEYTLLSMEFWGERSEGEWELTVENNGSSGSVLSTKILLEKWELIAYGTNDEPPMNGVA